jgi:hypothetical protein
VGINVPTGTKRILQRGPYDPSSVGVLRFARGVLVGMIMVIVSFIQDGR